MNSESFTQDIIGRRRVLDLGTLVEVFEGGNNFGRIAQLIVTWAYLIVRFRECS
jgi:hypothetical protein